VVNSFHREHLDAQDKRLEIQEREFKDFLARFDAFLQGRGGNGKQSV